jgi:hypothetical protein
MTHHLDLLKTTIRPRLLVAAARCGMSDYRRETDLRRALRGRMNGALPGPSAALETLFVIEAEMNDLRLSHEGVWRAARHVEVLIALMAEARCLQDSVAPPAEVIALNAPNTLYRQSA